MLLLLGFAFLSGFITILTPCIWPILPIIFSSAALSKSHVKPLAITLGILISFGVLTLALSYVVRLFNIDPNVFRAIAVVVLFVLGLIYLVPKFGSFIEGLVSRLTGIFGGNIQAGKTGLPAARQDFGSGLVTGLSLGVVWSPCAGPILAAIATLSATGKVTSSVFLVTFFYLLGVGIPLFIFSYGSQKLFSNTRFISKYTGRLQQIFGVIMILTAIAIYTNYDVYLQSQILNNFPGLNNALNGFESSKDVTNQLNKLKGLQQTQTPQVSNGLFNTNSPAPDFVGITKWLNLPAARQTLSLSDLKGKVVLVDFWTYTCINCIRTLPHVTTWFNTYNRYGFVVVGIHTPEFQFEHDTGNVENAIKMFGIKYPVGQDNNYATWNNYNNQYWPAEYLIDAKGNIRRTEFGEGSYPEMEQAIRTLLTENGAKITEAPSDMPDTTPTTNISPETYLGSSRMQYYYPDGSLSNGTQNFTLSNNLPENSFSYGGTWTIENEDGVSGQNAILNYNFSAGQVFIILQPPANGSGTVTVSLDGRPIDSSVAGTDVVNGKITVTTDRLYNIIDFHGKVENHILELNFSPGVKANTFTFGTD